MIILINAFFFHRNYIQKSHLNSCIYNYNIINYNAIILKRYFDNVQLSYVQKFRAGSRGTGALAPKIMVCKGR